MSDIIDKLILESAPIPFRDNNYYLLKDGFAVSKRDDPETIINLVGYDDNMVLVNDLYCFVFSFKEFELPEIIPRVVKDYLRNSDNRRMGDQMCASVLVAPESLQTNFTFIHIGKD